MTTPDSPGLTSHLLQFLIGHSHIGVASTDADGVILSSNHAFGLLCDRSDESLIGTNLKDVLSPSSKEHFDSALSGCRFGGAIEVQLNVLSASGVRRPCSARIWRDGDSVVVCFLDNCTVSPIADVATGAETVDAFLEQLGLRIYDAGRYNCSVSVVICEICNITDLESEYGSGVARRVAAMTGWTLRNLTRRSDYVARVANNQFAITLPETTLAAAVTAAEKLIEPIGSIGVETDTAVVAPVVRFGVVTISEPRDLTARGVLESARWAASVAAPSAVESVPLHGLESARLSYRSA